MGAESSHPEPRYVLSEIIHTPNCPCLTGMKSSNNIFETHWVEEYLPTPAVTRIWLNIEVWSAEERTISLVTRLLTTHQRQFDDILAMQGNQLKKIRAQHKPRSIMELPCTPCTPWHCSYHRYYNQCHSQQCALVAALGGGPLVLG